MVSFNLFSLCFFDTELPEDGKTHKSFSMYCQWQIHEKTPKYKNFISHAKGNCASVFHIPDPSADP